MPKKETLGTVISNKMDKTIVVAVKNPIAHKRYGKIVIKTNKYYVHDPLNEYRIGDKVKIQETRPLSKNTRWQVIKLSN